MQALGFRAAFAGQAAGPARSSSFHGSAAFASLPRAANKSARRSALTTQAKAMSFALPIFSHRIKLKTVTITLSTSLIGLG